MIWMRTLFLLYAGKVFIFIHWNQSWCSNFCLCVFFLFSATSFNILRLRWREIRWNWRNQTIDMKFNGDEVMIWDSFERNIAIQLTTFFARLFFFFIVWIVPKLTWKRIHSRIETRNYKTIEKKTFLIFFEMTLNQWNHCLTTSNTHTHTQKAQKSA